jgi:hypothetical protein
MCGLESGADAVTSMHARGRNVRVRNRGRLPDAQTYPSAAAIAERHGLSCGRHAKSRSLLAVQPPSCDGVMLAPLMMTATRSPGAGLYAPVSRAATPTEAAGSAAMRAVCHSVR